MSNLLKLKAVEFRRMGLSYGEIRKKIKVPKSTLSYWLKSVPLSSKQRQRLYTKQIEILSRGAPSQRERRAREVEKIIEDAKREIRTPLSFETYRLMGAALYWAEGGKRGMFYFTNSDPRLILFIVNWIESIFKVPPKGLKARLNIYPQQNEGEIKEFWSELTKIPLTNFGKSYVKPFNKGYKKNNLYYGTIRIDIPKSVNMKHQVFGWIKGAMQEIEPKVIPLQKKWEHLERAERPINLD